MLLLIKYTLLYGIVLMLVALGGMFSEHSGIINIALEGIMVIGGVAGVLTLTMLPARSVAVPHRAHLGAGGCAGGRGVQPAAGVRFHQPESGSDHRRHGPEPAGDGHRGGHRQVVSATAAVRQAELFQQALRSLFNIGGLEPEHLLSSLGIVLLIISLCACCTRPASACVCAPAVSIPRQPTRWASTSTRCAVCRCADLRCAGRHRRHGLHRAARFQTWNFEVGVAGAGLPGAWPL